MNGIFANYLRTMFWSVFCLTEWVWMNIKNTNIKRIDVPYICVYVWFKDDKHVIWMWIWLILKNICLLDRIWSLWLIHFAHSPTNFISWLGRLIFSVSINSHPDNVYNSDTLSWIRPVFTLIPQSCLLSEVVSTFTRYLPVLCGFCLDKVAP